MAAALTGNHQFEEAQNRFRQRKERTVTMADAFGQAEERGRAAGLAEGLSMVAERLLTMGSMTVEQIAQATTLPLEDVRALQAKK